MQKHALTFDVEEYFQVEAAAASGITRSMWDAYSPRVERQVDTVLELLAEHSTHATFFILGWVAQNHHKLVRRISEGGHEVASHGMTHAMLTRLTPKEFRHELQDSKALLEDLSGQAVLGFRAPTFSVMHQTAWALDELAATGYQYDSSVFPVLHDRYGVPDAPRWPHWATGPAGGKILEIPPLTFRALGRNWPAAGGGYLRLFPTWFFCRALRQAARQQQSGMLYLHPWELDPNHPVIEQMPRLRRWRHRVNLHQTKNKLRVLLNKFLFTATRDLLPTWQNAERTYSYGSRAASSCST